MHVLLLAFILWALMVILGAWWVNRITEEPDAPAAPPDPIVKTVDKWMHDWDRGRA